MRNGSIALLLAMGLLFAAGLLHLFNLRFEAGDVYPPYSSLRADPLGARALHDSLSGLLEVQRNFRSLSRLDDGRGTTLFYLGASSEDARFTTNQYRVFESFIRTGGRLVMAFKPEYVAPRIGRFTPTRPARPARVGPPPPFTGTNAPPARRTGRNPIALNEEPGTISIGERWNLDFGYEPLERDGASGPYRPVHARHRSEPDRLKALPSALAIHTALYFDHLNPEWRVIYARPAGTNDHPVLIERALGKGSIVLAADSYPFSNEALRQDRQSRLLAWFTGGRARIVFDETHLGTASDSGIAEMARRYRLHGLVAALVILAGLFIWRNAISFMPPPEDERAEETTHQLAGKDSTEGFINLLRRNVPPVDLLKVCLEQWIQTAAAVPGRKPTRARLEAMQRLIDEQNALEPRRRQPVQTYRQFQEILSQRT